MLTSLRRNSLLTTSLGVLSVWLMACAASPRRRPLDLGPVKAGPDSIEAVRRQFQGRWTLLSFETFPATGGPAVRHEATGELTYDEYGNLVVRGALPGAEPGAPAALLRYVGRAVIDVANRRLILQDLEGRGGEVLPASIAAEQARYYEFEADVLKLSVKDGSGRRTAVITWKKAQ